MRAAILHGEPDLWWVLEGSMLLSVAGGSVAGAVQADL
ncbi:putative membrane protein [Synechococcus sp. NOUM97013]|nr:putative membrane protein [Synechococcus sp. NOUM97013]